MMLLNKNFEAFLVVAKNRSIHASTTELGLTQTGITQRIKALEDELGCSLFLRSRKGMRLTREGEILMRYGARFNEIVGELSSQIGGREKSEDIILTLAGPTSVMGARIVSQCSQLVQADPGIYLNFLVDDHVNRVDLVKCGLADLAIIPPEQVPNEFDSKVLKPDKYLLVATPKWKGQRLSDILGNEKMIDFDERDPTTRKYLKEYDLIKFVKKRRLFANSNDTLIKMFCEGWGYGTLTQEVAEPNLDNGDLVPLNSGQAMRDPLALVWYPRNPMPKYFQNIIQSIS